MIRPWRLRVKLVRSPLGHHCAIVLNCVSGEIGFDYFVMTVYKGESYPDMRELMNTDTWREDAAQGIADGILVI